MTGIEPMGIIAASDPPQSIMSCKFNHGHNISDIVDPKWKLYRSHVCLRPSKN